MIEVYPSRLSDEGKEVYETEGRTSIVEWLIANGISEDADFDSLPMSVYLNGDRLLPSGWALSFFTPSDHVEIYREPKGTDPFSITFALVFGAKAVISALMPKLPTTNSSNRQVGRDLDEASSKGNKVKLNSLKVECAGYVPERFGDYALQPRRYFAGPREQRIEMLLFVGKGSYQKPVAGVKTGQTPLLSISADARFKFYEPGQDLTTEPAHWNWYNAPEVGASSSGAAGLELTTGSALSARAVASVFNFNADVVSIPSGAGSFPADWAAGVVVNAVAPYSYTIDDGTGSGGRDVINGPIAQHHFVVGDQIQIVGDNQGFYTVSAITSTTMQVNYDGGAAGTGLVVGPVTMGMSYRGMRFRILSISAQLMQVKRIKADGTDDNSWPGWESLSSNLGQVLLDSSNQAGGYRGPFPACPINEVVTAIEFDIFYPSGLVFLDAKGKYLPLNGYQSFEYRDMNLGGAWTAATYVATSDNLDAIGFTYRVSLPYPMRPECRIKKIFVNQGSGDPEKEQQDTMLWYGLRGLMSSESPTAYPGMTTLAVDIRGGDRISSQSESLISCEITRILPVLRNGVWQTPQPTREISAWIGYIMREVGYSDTEDLDIEELERLERDEWTPRGMTYDKIINEVDTVKGMLQEALIPGFSEFTLARGVIKPCFDGPRGEVFQAMYNPENMREALSREVVGPALPDQFDGVDVKYYSHVTKQNEVVSCRFPGEPGVRVREVTLEGVGNKTQAWRYGMRVLRRLRYQTETFEFDTELDALNSEYDDFVGLGDMTPQYGQASRMEGYADLGSSKMVEVLDALDWSTPGEHRVLIRRKDGTASGPYVATRVDDYRFTIPTLDFVPDLSGEYEPPFIQFGHKDRWIYRALIRDVNPKGSQSCSVSAVNYDERIYADDFNFPPT